MNEAEAAEGLVVAGGDLHARPGPAADETLIKNEIDIFSFLNIKVKCLAY